MTLACNKMHNLRTTDPIHFYSSDFHENITSVRVTNEIWYKIGEVERFIDIIQSKQTNQVTNAKKLNVGRT